MLEKTIEKYKKEIIKKNAKINKNSNSKLKLKKSIQAFW